MAKTQLNILVIALRGFVLRIDHEFVIVDLGASAIPRNGYQTAQLVHHLVARAFIGPSPYHVVNHKDGFVGSNRVDNLEYVTPGENNLHASVDRSKARQAGCSKPVIGRKLESDMWLAFISRRSAAQCLGAPLSSISKFCRGLQKQTYGYEFKWAPPSELPLLPGEQWHDGVFGSWAA